MQKYSLNLVFGCILILLGALFLANNMGYLYLHDELIAASVFLVAGAVFLIAYLFDRKKIWAMIVGLAGLFIGGAIYVEESRIWPEESIGILFLALTGLAFLNVFRLGRKNWWAIIPGGMSFVFAAVVYIESFTWLAEEYIGVMILGGLGLIFTIIYLLKNEEFKLSWAKYPAWICSSIAFMILFFSGLRDSFSDVVVPAVFVVVGGILIYNSFKKKNGDSNDKDQHDVIQVNQDLSGDSTPANSEIH